MKQTGGGEIRVAVVDDSPFVCRLLTSYLESSPDIRVVGAAHNGIRAVRMIEELRPDVVTVDLEMPVMNGLEVLELIMKECPTPVVLISGASRKAANLTGIALEIGAVDFVLKYTPGINTDPEELRSEIVAKVRAASVAEIDRSLKQGHWWERKQKQAAATRAATVQPSPTPPRPQPREGFIESGVVVIGASTGGPLALKALLGKLPRQFPAAIVVVQHIPEAFTEVMAEHLNRQVEIAVRVAREGDQLEPGVVLVAPGNFHLLLQSNSRIELTQASPVAGHRPSIDVTMQSVAQVYGRLTTGVVLTGMGSDGTMGLLAIQSKGGKTYAQDAESCVINGMPQRAIERGVVSRVASPERIAEMLLESKGMSNREPEALLV